MKRLLITLVLITTISGYSQEQATTYYLIRHAEKDRSDTTEKNPQLTEKGMQRALQWSEVLKNIPFDAVYSTNYKRTIQTATPTAEKNDLEILIYEPGALYNSEFIKNSEGKTILIVGHSNSTPKLVNKIIGSNTFDHIDDRNNSNLYIVTSIGDLKTVQLLYIE